MSTSINTNLASLFAQNSLSGAQNRLADSVQRLSSGLRINSAKDDAAGLAIAQNMQSQLNGVNQSIRNLSDATNLIQTAESSLATIQDMLLRMKQLSTQGYNGSLSATQKNAIVNEVQDLNSEINATAVRTQFNGINLLSSGQKVDSLTGDIFAGQYLTKTAIGINSSSNLLARDEYTISSAGAVTVTNNGGGTGTSAYTIALDNDVFKRDMVGTYNLTSYDDKLTMTYTDANTGKISQQTITVNKAQGDGANAKTTTQILDYSDFGITLTLENTINANGSDALGASIASAFSGKSLIIDGQSSQITGIDLRGTQSAQYTITNTSRYETASVRFQALADSGDSFTFAGVTVTATAATSAQQVAAIFASLAEGGTPNASGGATITGTLTGYTTGAVTSSSTAINDTVLFTSTNASASDVTNLTDPGDGIAAVTVTAGAGAEITLSYTDNLGVAHEEAVALLDTDFVKNSDFAIKFGDSGVTINIHNFQSQTGAQIANQLANLYGVDGNTTNKGNLRVLNTDASLLNFQSGPTTDAFIGIKTLNVMTGSDGITAGSANEMKAVGTLITADLEGLDSSNSDAEWQAVFSSLGAAIDDAIDYISTERAVYGSQINRLSFMTTNLQANSTNLHNSRSSIIDTDFAAETAALTKGQIMQQAATAMLAQANQMPNVILSLLK
jgi:flagellin